MLIRYASYSTLRATLKKSFLLQKIKVMKKTFGAQLLIIITFRLISILIYNQIK
jgi:hypothetical protein